MRSGFGTALARASKEGTLAAVLQDKKDGEIAGLLQQGWTLHKENGRQVILKRDGQTITRYRPR